MVMNTLVSAEKDTNADNRLLDYDCKKTTQALNYLLQKSHAHSLHKVALVKLLWAADRYHLRRYSRLVSDEPYVAMERGPVGSLAKDIIYGVAGYNMSEGCLPYTSSYIQKVDDNVSSLRSTDEGYLSKTDVEALDFAWKNFGHLRDDWEKLVDIAHQYPEWNKHVDSLLKNRTVKAAPIELHDFFKDPKNIENDPFAIDETLKQLSLEMFDEACQIKALLSK